jgi:hypothetical protein
MLREYYGAELRPPRRTRIGAMLVHAGVAATVGLASAVSGAAVALHLAAPPPSQYLLRSGGAATAAAIRAEPMEKPMILADAPPSPAQARTAASPEIVSDAAATNRAASAASPASPLAEHELTFAWGYAQRHPDAAVRQAQARIVPTVASAGTHAAALAAKSDSRRPAQRQHRSVAQRETVGLASSGFFAGFGGDRHQALGYTEERGANGLGFSSRAQFSAQRTTTTRPNLRNHDKPRS